MAQSSERVAALIRVSTDEQTSDPQRLAVRRWASANGFHVRWYAEDGVSGAAKSRPVLDRLMADARAGRVRTVVVAALDRLGRSAVDLIVRLDELRRLGVRVVSLRESLDFSTTAGQLVGSVLAHVAQMEREALRERTRAGIAAARKRGVRLGRPSLVWRPAEVSELRELRAAGHSLPAIHAAKSLRVFDTQGRAVVPSVRAMRRALAGDAA
jgi:putative DNA-invertase from lambdoid prophage Rac